MKSYTYLILPLLFFSCKISFYDEVSPENEYYSLNENIKPFTFRDDFRRYVWSSNDTKYQTKTYKNGLYYISYNDLEDGFKKRFDYKYGDIESTSVVRQVYRIDTVWQIDAITLEDEMVIDTGFIDVFVGGFRKYQTFWFSNYYWEDTVIINQRDYWENGNIKVRYENDTLGRIRFDYNNKGELLRKSLVKQNFVNDTTWQINATTLEDEQIINIGFTDYFDTILLSRLKYPLISGQFKNNIRIGKWYLRLDSTIVEIEYDENGDLNNYLNEYYILDNDKMILKSKGNFRTLTYTDTIWFDSNSYYIGEKTDYLKTGMWYFNNIDGSKDKKINFSEDSIFPKKPKSLSSF